MQTAHQLLIPVPCDPGADVCAFQRWITGPVVLVLWPLVHSHQEKHPEEDSQNQKLYRMCYSAASVSFSFYDLFFPAHDGKHLCHYRMDMAFKSVELTLVYVAFARSALSKLHNLCY